MKKKLIKLANKLGFVSEIIGKSVESKYSKKDFYYLWMCELQKWLMINHNLFVEVNMHSDSNKREEDYFSNKKDFLFSVEVNYYGKKFEIEQTDDVDFFYTHYMSWDKALEEGLVVGIEMIEL